MRPVDDFDEVEADVPDIKPLTADEARQLRERHPPVSPWWVILGQASVGALVALAAWGITGTTRAGWSAAWGALAVVLPAAVFARGVTRRGVGANPGAAVAGFLGWEFVKIALTLALLALAPRVVQGLSWLALVVGLVATMKTWWLAFLIRAVFRRKAAETLNTSARARAMKD
ncbi:ATP synthase subunit I [Xylophilus sp. GOD-11R]|uniref:ATP synthase subunit I n=1 Tax=Xylophilus sp. GOD-11R TaxID=3089814 RepID=UPI00298C7E75|nr:ATP synthase subunit I [Xylophilus sp. GOD-11R]WPB56773.1 ATP synthase subunit I [Xylophilus sp. GOD-11R]